MSITEARRKNQIVADRTMAKARRETDVSGWTDNELWAAIKLCIENDLHTRRMLGHIARGVDAVQADLALQQLVLRGTQGQLFS